MRPQSQHAVIDLGRLKARDRDIEIILDQESGRAASQSRMFSIPAGALGNPVVG